ncbi:MAG TPA: TniQ family protein [Methylotenera sp.]|nr:TniQ family protein [Methylotenera sp.]
MKGLSGNLWPIHLKPYPNELLSSWLVRLAHAHGLKLQSFCAIVFGPGKSIWNRDIDKLSPDWLLKHLAIATGTSLKRVKETTLKSYEGILYERHQPNGNTRWIIPLGVYHRIHQHPGLQFCPVCLASDKEPYFRKYWRLAFYTECEKHHILLHDRCPHCGEAVNFHRVEMGIRSLIKPRSIVNCYKCNYDLRDASKNVIHCSDWQAVIQQRTLLAFHELGWGFTENLTIQYSHQLFDVLRHLCTLMLSKNRAGGLLPYISKKICLDNIVINISTHVFEKLTVRERHYLFLCANWFILKWPSRFIEVSNNMNLTNAYLLEYYKEPPYWFRSIIETYLSKRRYSPTLDEIQSVEKYLIANGLRTGISNISRLLGCTTLKRSKQLLIDN